MFYDTTRWRDTDAGFPIRLKPEGWQCHLATIFGAPIYGFCLGKGLGLTFFVRTTAGEDCQTLGPQLPRVNPPTNTGSGLKRTSSGGVVLEGMACVLVGDLGETQPSEVKVSLHARMAVVEGPPASSSMPIEVDWGTHTVTAQPLMLLRNCPVHPAKPGAQHVGLPCAALDCKGTQATLFSCPPFPMLHPPPRFQAPTCSSATRAPTSPRPSSCATC